MIGEMTRKAFAAWLLGDEAWRRYGETHVLDDEDGEGRATLKTRLLLASRMVDALAEAEGIRAVVFRGDGADDVGVPQFETRFAHGEVDSRFGELDLDLAQLDAALCSDAKSAFQDFLHFLRQADIGYTDRDFQSVMLYLRSQPCSVRPPAKGCKLYAVRVAEDNPDHPRSWLLPWAFAKASRAKDVLIRLAESVVPRNWDRYRIVEGRGKCVIDKLPLRTVVGRPHFYDEYEHLTLSVETIDVPRDFAAVPNAEGDWFVGNWDHMRTKNWDTRHLDGAAWLERLNPHYYHDHEGIENHDEWSRRVEDAGAKCDWWKIDFASLSVWQWLFVLRFRADLADKCSRWSEFSHSQWCMLLRRQPQFAGRCSRFAEFWPELWSFLLSRQPQFADRCTCWGDMYPDAWERLLKAQPQFLERIDLAHADGDIWAKVVKCCPERAENCPWDKLSDRAWADLLPSRPEFAAYCDFGKFDGNSWGDLLSVAPQFIVKCDVSKISAYEWYGILEAQPQLAGYFKKWNDLNGEQQLQLLQKSPQICRCVDFAALPLKTRIDYLLLRPEFADKMNWQDVVDPEDWYRLLACMLECERYAPADAVRPEANGRVWLGKTGPVVVIPRPGYDWISDPPPFDGSSRIRAGQYLDTPWGVTHRNRGDYRDEMPCSSASEIVDFILENETKDGCFSLDIEGVYVDSCDTAGVVKFTELLKDWFASHETTIRVVHLECGALYGRIALYAKQGGGMRRDSSFMKGVSMTKRGNGRLGREEGLMSILPTSMLKQVLSVPSVTYREERMRDFVVRFARSRKIAFATDKIGNVYLTKGKIGKDEYVPCFVNHMDTVQDAQREYVDCCKRLPVKERKNEEGQTELYVDGFGIGGDNKAGCAIALALMVSLPKCKAEFFVQEETGLVGAKQMDYGFLSNVSLLVTMDYWGRIRTASEWRKNGAKMYSQEFYDTVLKDVFDRHGVTVRDHRANTDICHLMMNCDLCCCDVSNGGYKPHELDEYVCVEDAKASYNLILDLCRHLDPHRVYRIGRQDRGGGEEGVFVSAEEFFK